MQQTKLNSIFYNVVKNKPRNVCKRYFTETRCSLQNDKKTYLLAWSPWKICTGISLGLGIRYLCSNGPSFCKAAVNSRIIQRRTNLSDDSSKFDWKRFLEYLWPHRWILIVAVAVSNILMY